MAIKITSKNTSQGGWRVKTPSIQAGITWLRKKHPAIYQFGLAESRSTDPNNIAMALSPRNSWGPYVIKFVVGK